MRKLLLLCAIFLALSVYAQDTKITGVVKDEKNEPVSGASIKIRGTSKGTYTDDKGHFTIIVSPNATLEISSVGFNKQDIKVKGQTSIEIVLATSTSSMEDVVVIGYQKITRKKTTAAISSISGKEIENLPAASFDQLMQGRLAGVNVQNFSGDPGASPSVSVRGNTRVSRNWDENNVVNSPLYVVDGVPQSNEKYVTSGAGTGMNYLGGVNPNDIESIDVLKDASAAAIYGSRAANGVILITTKKGRSGEPKVLFSGFAGITTRPQLREVTVGTTERRQKMAVLQSQLTYDQQKQLPYLLTDSLNPAFNGNTDWQNMFYQTGIIKSGDLSLSGGSENGTNYRFSAGYYDEKGILKATGTKRYSVRLNLASKALKGKLEINPVIYFTRSDRDRGGSGADPRYEGTDYNPYSLGSGNMPSSLLNLSSAKQEGILGNYNTDLDKNIENVFNFNLNLGYSFSKSFKFNSLSSYQLTNSRRNFNRTNAMENGFGNYSYSFTDYEANMLTSNYLSYNNLFGKHSLGVVVGQDILFNQYENTIAAGANGASDQIQTVRGFIQSKIGASSDYQAYGLLSYYARLAYDFNSKYLFSFAGRYDGSSRFGTNNKWGFFPSASAAWLISEENFMKNSMFSMLKLRASIGTSGSLPDANYLQYNLYLVNNGAYNGNLGATSYNGVTTVTPNFYNGVAQKNLSWEKATQWNIGMDFEIQQGKYSAAIDIFNRENTLQFTNVNLPVTSGYSVANTNSTGVRNAGVELTLTANPLPANSTIKWFSRVNVSYTKNTIMNLPNGGRDYVLDGDRFDKSHISSVGSPLNSFYLYKTLGVYATDDDVPVNKYTGERFRSANGAYSAGAFQFADLDGDYLIDIFNSGINPDKIPIGDPNPKITGGWTNNITWKNFTLGLFFSFTFNRDVMNLYKADQFSNSTDGNANENFAAFSIPNLDKINIWRKPGDQAEFARYDLGTYLYYYTSAQTFFLTKGDYFRLKSLNLQYSLGQNIIRRMKIDGLKFFVIADNLLKWQSSKDLPDAENVNSYGEYNGNGYPIPRKFTIGFQMQF
ncbi:MAG: SusC/RagA family TonB-linked outer membrane protein [Agriterribacter sp.]